MLEIVHLESTSDESKYRYKESEPCFKETEGTVVLETLNATQLLASQEEICSRCGFGALNQEII